MVQPLIIPSAEILPEDEFAIESAKFWRHDRDLAALLVYVRKAGAPSIDYLVSPSKLMPGMTRAWTEGCPLYSTALLKCLSKSSPDIFRIFFILQDYVTFLLIAVIQCFQKLQIMP